MTRTYHVDGMLPPGDEPNWVFVFGSNLAGRHGGGAAYAAHRNFGAQYGVGVGPTGRAYAIPTKSANIETLSLDSIRDYVGVFLTYARQRPGQWFFVTRIGCGLAGYTDADIAPMFRDAPFNCDFAESWKPFLEVEHVS